MNNREGIIRSWIEGQSLKAIARKFDRPVEEITEIVDGYCAQSLSPAARARTTARVRGREVGCVAIRLP
jgi:hypothetical protein